MANNPCFGNHLFILTILGRPRWHSEAMEEDPSETGSVSEAWPVTVDAFGSKLGYQWTSMDPSNFSQN